MLQQYDMTISKLVQLILNLSYIQRKALLKKGQQLFVRGTRSFRKSCQIPVKYSTLENMGTLNCGGLLPGHLPCCLS